LREFEAQATSTRERLSILEQGSLGATARGAQTAGIENIMARMTKIIEAGELANDRMALLGRLDSLQKKARALKPESADTPLAHLPPKQRATYEHFFNMIYECSTNRVAAKALVDRLLAKIFEPPPVPVRRPVQRAPKRKGRGKSNTETR
jgi:molecular chaperone HtpG